MLAGKSDREPIASVGDLHKFVATRSAYVAQKTLYGYLKTRMGTRYPSMFEDDQMIASIDIAKMRLYAACVTDLSVFCVVNATTDAKISEDELSDMCLNAYDHAIAENAGDSVDEQQRADRRTAFLARLSQTDWLKAANNAEYGLESPNALLKWAPIAPELKKLDVEIVRNSVRFTWHEVRSQFRNRVDGPAIVADWQNTK